MYNKETKTQIKSLCVNDSNVQVQGVEEKDKVFAAVVRQPDVFELPIDDSSAVPVRGRLRNWKTQKPMKHPAHISHSQILT